MPKSLIIAEKPSLAKNICAAISPAPRWVAGKVKNTGYYENDKYIVSYAFGHLLELNAPDDYDNAYKSWSLSLLPIFPRKFIYKEPKDPGAKAQLDLLKSLINSDKIGEVINAGDSDREGEIIVRNILRHSDCNKTVYRLWMPDQTAKTIKTELDSVKLDTEYDNLAFEGYARTIIDWLYGINLTRLVSKKCNSYEKYKQPLRVGRVTSPIVTAICEREREIRNFVPEKYYVALHDNDGLKLTSKTKNKTADECNTLCDKYNALKTIVTEKKTTKKTLPRPKLFALSDLQGVAGEELKLSPKDVLDIVQQLYEAGYVTYPRTNSNYMTESEKDKAKEIIEAVKKGSGSYEDISFRDSKEIFDDKQVEAHSALTPTTSFPKKITDLQSKVYNIILRRFASAFCTEEYVVDRTNLTIDNGIEEFKLVGDITVTPGYTKYEPAKKSAVLPPLNKGDEIQPNFKTAEKETTPPDHYTAKTLNAYLKNPYSAQEKKNLSGDSEIKEVISEVELGTEATRATLIDAAIKNGYITFKSNRYGITDFGEYYVDCLSKLGIDMTKERTLNLSKSLKMVYRGNSHVKELMKDAEIDIADICKNAKAINIQL